MPADCAGTRSQPAPKVGARCSKGLGGAQRGLHQREELEVDLPAFEPDAARWPAGEARDRALELSGGAPLETLVTLSQTRSVRLLYAGERLIAELSLDRVVIALGSSRAEHIDLEVEAEAKGDGGVDEIRALAEWFESELCLTPQPLSKFERALALLRDADEPGGGPATSQDEAAADDERLRPGDRAIVERVAATARTTQARRARLLLAWDDGADVRELQESLGYSRSSVYFWIDAYARKGLDVFPPNVLAQAEAAPPADEAPAPRRPRAGRPAPTLTPGPTEAVAAEPPPDEAAPEPPPPIPMAELMRRYDVDLAHGRHVADLAMRLFDLTAGLHHLPAASRKLLEKAGLLHNLGLATDPERHHTVGRDLLLATPVVELADLQRRMIAATIFLHRKRISPRKLEKEVVASLPDATRAETLELAALIRIADGLDYSLSQTTRIVGGRVSPITVDVILSGPLSAEDAARAQTKADLWDQLHSVPFRYISVSGDPLAAQVRPDQGSNAHEEGAADPDEAGGAPEEVAPPEAEAAPAVTESRPPVAPEESPLLASALAGVPPTAPGIRPDDATAEAGRKVLAFHLARMLKHEPGARQGEDIEEVHDMRVAARRLRSAFRVFDESFQKGALAPYLKHLRRVGETLGAVRDLDVLMDNARNYQAGLPADQSDAVEPLVQAWAAQREVARRNLIRYLNSEGYSRFTAAFAEFVTSPGTGARRPDPERPEPYLARHVAPRLIYTAFERVRSYETLLDQPSLELLHALRIEGKRLRYTLEFLREVLGPESALVIAETTALQDHLGALHDADVAEMLLRNFLNGTLAPGPKHAARPRVLAPGVALYLATRQGELQRLLTTFPDAWARFNRPEVRQSLALAVSVL